MSQPDNRAATPPLSHHKVKHTTPAIVTQSAVRPLPRWMLMSLCIAYVIAGFIGREPWKSADITAFGVMWGMAQDHVEWLWPTVMNSPVENHALLPYWIGALAIEFLPIHPEIAARLPFAVGLGATFYLTWFATFRMALSTNAQPVVFAFGGEAQPIDYARAMADGALLALMACLGLAQLSHEITPDAIRLLCMAMLLHGAATLFNTTARPSRLYGTATWITGLVLLGLSGGAQLALIFSLLMPCAHAVSSSKMENVGHTEPSHTAWAAWATGGVASLALTLWVPAQARLSGGVDLINPDLWLTFGQLLLWFTWPVWPLAIWTVWRWRRQLRDSHLMVPLIFVAILTLVSVLDGASDRRLLGALPALAMLAAFALPTLKRSVAAFIDWFSVLFFSTCSITIWVLWIAMITGVPERPAANISRLAPGFKAEFVAISFFIALMTTVVWLLVVRWRVSRHQPAIWKSLVLPATGGTLCWVLLMTLWLPLLDFGRSYGPISRRIAQMIPDKSCTNAWGLTQAQMAGLSYHGGLTLIQMPGKKQCQTMIVSNASVSKLEKAVDVTQWAFKMKFNRLTDNKESLWLYQRVERAPKERAPMAEQAAEFDLQESVK